MTSKCGACFDGKVIDSSQRVVRDDYDREVDSAPSGYIAFQRTAARHGDAVVDCPKCHGTGLIKS